MIIMNSACGQLSLQPAEQIPLVDADIYFWPQIDLGFHPDKLLNELIDTTTWRQEQITVYGKPYLQPRLSAWFGDCSYGYSGITLQPSPWTKILQDLRQRINRNRKPLSSILLSVILHTSLFVVLALMVLHRPMRWMKR